MLADLTVITNFYTSGNLPQTGQTRTYSKPAPPIYPFTIPPEGEQENQGYHGDKGRNSYHETPKVSFYVCFKWTAWPSGQRVGLAIRLPWIWVSRLRPAGVVSSSSWVQIHSRPCKCQLGFNPDTLYLYHLLQITCNLLAQLTARTSSRDKALTFFFAACFEFSFVMEKLHKFRDAARIFPFPISTKSV